MATYAGKNGRVHAITYSDGSETAAAIGEVKDFSLEITNNLVEDTVLGDSWTSQKTTTQSWSATVNCIYNPEDAAQDDMKSPSQVTVELYPQGNTTGLEKFKGPANVESVSFTVSVDGLTEASYSLRGTGELAQTTL